MSLKKFTFIFLIVFTFMISIVPSNIFASDSNHSNYSTNIIESDPVENLDFKVITINDGIAVKIRSHGEVIQIAYSGETYKAVAKQGDWYKVICDNGDYGWIPSRYVQLSNDEAYLKADRVNFREDSDISSDIHHVLSKGDTFTVLDFNDSWAKIKIGNKEGFIKSRFIAHTEYL